MATSEARVITDRPGRYAKQLVNHMSRKCPAEWDPETGTGSMSFSFGSARMLAETDALLLTVDGTPEDLERLESVLGKHLVRFGTKDELLVRWQRNTGEPGTVWSHQETESE